MKIALLHYHLRQGGVTTVIRQQAAALSEACDLLVISGEKPDEPFPVRLVCIPGLAYDIPGTALQSPQQTARQVAEAIRHVWPEGCDVLHVHNPLLAKNRHFLKILTALQDMDIPLFLQVHDFAEDGRPAAYYTDGEYPADCHYGVINTRDYAVLKRSGLSPAGLHLLFNMVNPMETADDKTIPERFIVYPIRAIRRKNIGEALLLSICFSADQMLAITLPPSSPADCQSYARWRAFASDRRLSVLFEACSRYDFASLVGSADALITTSISEGFGFAFLEPWTAGKGLIGRRLEICRDFEKNGLRLDHLYSAIEIPLSWIDEPAFYDQWRFGLIKNSRKLSVRMDPVKLQSIYLSMTRNGTIDFGLISESLQQQVIDRIISDTSAHRRLQALNPFLRGFTDTSVFDHRIENNRRAVLRYYDADAYRSRLISIYRHVAGQPVRHRIRKTTLAREFLRPENFSLIKWDESDV